jgi:uncharacterized protein YqjF (DUF2071 family)
VFLEQPIDRVIAPFVQGRVTRITDHRPWPMPKRPWVMAQTWKNLLFAHWPVPPDALRAVMPSQLPLDTFDGRAWLGVTPFAVRNLRARLTFPLPIISAFPEINVRTYVTLDGKPGIYFFSLDAASRPAVETARRFYRLPYFRARMSIHTDDGDVRFQTERTGPKPDPPPATFRAQYQPRDEPFQADPGTLEHWLTERYCLYTLNDQRRPLRADIHHPPWPLQQATADIEVNTMAAQITLRIDGDPLLHYAARQDVVFWKLEDA